MADVLLLELAFRVLQQCIAGAPGLDVDFERVRNRIARANLGLKKVASKGGNTHSRESVAQRLASPFFLAPATAYSKVLAVALQDNAARAKAEATRPGED